MRLWQKAQDHGSWNPSAIDYAADRQCWLQLPFDIRRRLLRLFVAFQLGEASVASNLLPFLSVVSAEGRREDAIYLSSFLSDEAKHVDVCERIISQVCGGLLSEPTDLQVTDNYTRILDFELRSVLQRLATDHSVEAQVRASVTYHLVVEGVLGEVAFYALLQLLQPSDRLPGVRRAFTMMHRDESRHIAFGIYFLQRLIHEHGDRAYDAFVNRLSELRPSVSRASVEFATTFGDDDGVLADTLVRRSRARFADRVQRIVGAGRRSVGG